jgi:hypothetical protein
VRSGRTALLESCVSTPRGALAPAASSVWLNSSSSFVAPGRSVPRHCAFRYGWRRAARRYLAREGKLLRQLLVADGRADGRLGRYRSEQLCNRTVEPQVLAPSVSDGTFPIWRGSKGSSTGCQGVRWDPRDPLGQQP